MFLFFKLRFVTCQRDSCNCPAVVLQLASLGFAIDRLLVLQLLGCNEDIELGDMYCKWSATLTMQEISQHYDTNKEVKKHLGQGEPLAFKYMPRPRRKPPENIRSHIPRFSDRCVQAPHQAQKG